MGTRTLFVRFGGCDLRCRWCDSPRTWKPAARCRIEIGPGTGNFETRENPVSANDVVAVARALGGSEHRYASLTGGEPLLQAEAVLGIATALRQEGLAVLLETHGLAYEGLGTALAAVDIVSMDWKLASDVPPIDGSSAAQDFHDAHQRFLERALGASQVIVKVVVTPATRDQEIDEVARRVASTAPQVPLVLQPVTPVPKSPERPSAAQLLAWQRRALVHHGDVRVIAQTHVQVGAL